MGEWANDLSERGMSEREVKSKGEPRLENEVEGAVRCDERKRTTAKRAMRDDGGEGVRKKTVSSCISALSSFLLPLLVSSAPQASLNLNSLSGLACNSSNLAFLRCWNRSGSSSRFGSIFYVCEMEE